MIDISVIIVNWNTKDLVINLINSLKKQNSGLNSEIIVVDNASTDGSVEAIKKIYNDVIIVKNRKNLGFSKANNAGIKISRGKYLAFINSDVELNNGCLNLLYDFLEQNQKIGMVGPKLLNSDGSYQPSCRDFPSIRNMLTESLLLYKIFPKSKILRGEFRISYSSTKPQPVEALVGAFLFTRKEYIDRVGMLDDNYFMYGEDVDWCKRFWDNGIEVYYFPEAEAVHFQAKSSSKDPIYYYVMMQKSKILYWKKHHGKILAFVIKQIMVLRHILRLIIHLIIYLIRKKNIHKNKLRRSFTTLKYIFNFMD